jgi:hypothetical protein
MAFVVGDAAPVATAAADYMLQLGEIKGMWGMDQIGKGLSLWQCSLKGGGGGGASAKCGNLSGGFQ